jgi:hypothetical protein
VLRRLCAARVCGARAARAFGRVCAHLLRLRAVGAPHLGLEALGGEGGLLAHAERERAVAVLAHDLLVLQRLGLALGHAGRSGDSPRGRGLRKFTEV